MHAPPACTLKIRSVYADIGLTYTKFHQNGSLNEFKNNKALIIHQFSNYGKSDCHSLSNLTLSEIH